MAAPSDDPTTPPSPSRRSAAVVTASDRSAAGEREDVSGPAVAALLEAEGYAVAEVVVVPDERDRIAGVLTRLADESGVTLVAVTGGTGFAPRDVTPEATRDVIEREAPGLAEAMRAASSRTTANAFLSRGVCGVRGTTLILNLPGSPSGATESLSAVLGLLPHAMAQIVGVRDHTEPKDVPAADPRGGAPAMTEGEDDVPAFVPAATPAPTTPSGRPAVDPEGPGPRSPEPPTPRRRGLASLLGRSKELDAAQRAAVLESLVLASGEDLPHLRAATATSGPEPTEAAPTSGSGTTADRAAVEVPLAPTPVTQDAPEVAPEVAPQVEPAVPVTATDPEVDVAPPAEPTSSPPQFDGEGSLGATDASAGTPDLTEASVDASGDATSVAAADAPDAGDPEVPGIAEAARHAEADADPTSTPAAAHEDASTAVDAGDAPTTLEGDAAESEPDHPQRGRRGLLGRVRDRLAGDDGHATGFDDDLDDDDDLDVDDDEADEDDEDELQDLEAEAVAQDLVDDLSVDVEEASTPRPRLVSFGWAEDAQDAVRVDRGADLDPVTGVDDEMAPEAHDDALEDDRGARSGRRGRSRRRRARAGDGPAVLDGPTSAAASSAPEGAADEGPVDRALLPAASERDEADAGAPRSEEDAGRQPRRSRLGRLAGTTADWLTAAAIVMVVLAMATLLASDQPPVTVGEVPLPTVAQPEAPEESADPDVEPDPIIVATVAPPMTIRIPTITVDATVVPVGLEPDGAMEIPRDVQTIGWYDPQGYGGVVPGSNGTAVLSGHVDSRSQGPGAFYYLRNLGLGDEIEVVHEDGTVTRWIVTGRTQYDKDVIPLEEIFVWEGAPRLALITCGGEFDRTARSYRDNIVVLAEPLSA